MPNEIDRANPLDEIQNLRGKALRLDLCDDKRAQENIAFDHTDDVRPMLPEKGKDDLIAPGDRSASLARSIPRSLRPQVGRFSRLLRRHPAGRTTGPYNSDFDHLSSELSDLYATNIFAPRRAHLPSFSWNLRKQAETYRAVLDLI